MAQKGDLRGAEGGQPAIISDHAFRPPYGRWWGLCVFPRAHRASDGVGAPHCGLAEAAHTRSELALDEEVAS